MTILSALDEAPEEENLSLDPGLDDLVKGVGGNADFDLVLKALGLKFL